MEARLFLPDFDDGLRAIVREEVERALSTGRSEPSPWLSAKSAAAYLDWSEHAVRSAVKRGQLPVHRTQQGRLLFNRHELDAWVRGDAS